MTAKARRPKALRLRGARADLLMALATSTVSWEAQLRDQDPHTRPYAEWSEDDWMKAIALKNDVGPHDLAKLLHDIGGSLEARAVRAAAYDQGGDHEF